MPEICSALIFIKVPRNWRLLAKEIGVETMNNAGYPVRYFTFNSSHTAKRLRKWGVGDPHNGFPVELDTHPHFLKGISLI